MTENIESRFSVFKRSLSEEYEALVPSAGKRFKKCDIEFKSKEGKIAQNSEICALRSLAYICVLCVLGFDYGVGWLFLVSYAVTWVFLFVVFR